MILRILDDIGQRSCEGDWLDNKAPLREDGQISLTLELQNLGDGLTPELEA
jgi:hypothetical protein